MTEALPAWRQERERGGLPLLKAMVWAAQRSPDWFAKPVIWLFALYFTVTSSSVSKNGSDRYLTKVLGGGGFGRRFRQILTFAHVIYERAQLLNDGVDRFHVVPNDHSQIEDLVNANRSAILLGAHFGSFEALRAFDRTLPGLSVKYLMYQENAEAVTRALEAINPDIAAQVIPVADGPNAMLAVRETLDHGHFVAFLGDRVLDRSPRAQVTVDFMGEDIVIPRAPYLCALMARVPLILLFAVRTDHRTYEIQFTQIYDGAEVPRGQREDTVNALAQTYVDELGKMCRRHPYNWFNFFDIWGEDGSKLPD